MPVALRGSGSVTSTSVLITDATSLDRLNLTPRRSGRHNAEVGGSSPPRPTTDLRSRTDLPSPKIVPLFLIADSVLLIAR